MKRTWLQPAHMTRNCTCLCDDHPRCLQAPRGSIIAEFPAVLFFIPRLCCCCCPPRDGERHPLRLLLAVCACSCTAVVRWLCLSSKYSCRASFPPKKTGKHFSFVAS
ncbi:unnamed protein product [Ectocarpus sp. 12 AP-2014]